MGVFPIFSSFALLNSAFTLSATHANGRNNLWQSMFIITSPYFYIIKFFKYYYCFKFQRILQAARFKKYKKTPIQKFNPLEENKYYDLLFIK
ncbi:hypothetical protein REG_1670 [Candidatus Regiella insecticola LSR1]|uniref:Uncharacterized protein n=1 Tax=Candidatus Regiella insecticola LSR1 TaxID=663321 RepID=E0WUK5_9ENTR|nr:hypothetical protein REG_1670 [Candidatus Regiella insecticola LSR1]